MEKKRVTLHEKEFEIMLSQEDINVAVSNITEQINSDYETKQPLFLCVLNGSFLFAADLLKQINLDCEITFVKMASYVGTHSTGNVNTLIGLDQELENRDIIVLEDIVDTGLTLENLMKQLDRFSPTSVTIATMLYKPDACVGRFKPNYVGIEIEDKFVVGYGLDYNGLGRNLTDIYKVVD